ncbi:MAG: hypothetical protein R3F61_14020 [Myxococcota bacterium]
MRTGILALVLAGCATPLDVPDRSSCTETVEWDYDADGAVDSVETRVHDAKERLVDHVWLDATGDRRWERTRYDGDCAERFEQVEEAYEMSALFRRSCDANGDFVIENGEIVSSDLLFASHITWDRQYDDAGRTTHFDRSTTYDGDTSTDEADFEYDRRGRLVRSAEVSPGRELVTELEWLDDDRLLSKVTSTGDATYVNLHTYDALGRLIESRDGDEDHPVVTTYRWEGDLWRPTGRSEDADGERTEVESVCEGDPWTRCVETFDTEAIGRQLDGVPDRIVTHEWTCP